MPRMLWLSWQPACCFHSWFFIVGCLDLSPATGGGHLRWGWSCSCQTLHPRASITRLIPGQGDSLEFYPAANLWPSGHDPGSSPRRRLRGPQRAAWMASGGADTDRRAEEGEGHFQRVSTVETREAPGGLASIVISTFPMSRQAVRQIHPQSCHCSVISGNRSCGGSSRMAAPPPGRSMVG